ncbi:MAG: PEP-CTERM sorting domain-containing protein [Planctomycetota bacterium]
MSDRVFSVRTAFLSAVRGPGSLRGATAAVAAAVFVAGGARGELIAADSFLIGDPADASAGEYEADLLRRGNPDAGQNPTIDGFTDPWTGNRTTGNGAVAQWTAVDGSVDGGLSYIGGGRARFSGVDNTHRRVQRDLDTYTPVDTYYMSFLGTAALGDIDGDGFVGIGFTNDVSDAELEIGGSDGMRGLVVGFRANANGTTDLVLRHRDRLADGVSFGAKDELLVADVDAAGSAGVGVYQVVVKAEIGAAPFDPDGDDVLSVWINRGEPPVEPVSALQFQGFSFSSNNDLTQLTLTGIDYSRPASFDEPRLGTEWTDVVPEPSSLFLIVGGVALAAARRRPA